MGAAALACLYFHGKESGLTTAPNTVPTVVPSAPQSPSSGGSAVSQLATTGPTVPPPADAPTTEAVPPPKYSPIPPPASALPGVNKTVIDNSSAGTFGPLKGFQTLDIMTPLSQKQSLVPGIVSPIGPTVFINPLSPVLPLAPQGAQSGNTTLLAPVMTAGGGVTTVIPPSPPPVPVATVPPTAQVNPISISPQPFTPPPPSPKPTIAAPRILVKPINLSGVSPARNLPPPKVI